MLGALSFVIPDLIRDPLRADRHLQRAALRIGSRVFARDDKAFTAGPSSAFSARQGWAFSTGQS